MSYNLLFDTEFQNNRWEFINCTFNNKVLSSNSKVFGICQELILPDITKIYFRINFKILSPNVKSVKIGIQTDNTLVINTLPIDNDLSYLSVIDSVKKEKIKVHLIFEGDKENQVHIEQPLLVDLKQLNKDYWTQKRLDKTIAYEEGYNYKNLISNNIFNRYPKANIGYILEDAELFIDFEAEDKFYLAKLDYVELNDLGETYFEYGTTKSIKLEEQCYIIFRAKKDIKLKLIIKGNDILPYKVNVKNILIIPLNKLSEDMIPNLPFI